MEKYNSKGWDTSVLTLVNLTPDDLKSDPDLGYDSPRLKPYYYKFWLKIEARKVELGESHPRIPLISDPTSKVLIWLKMPTKIKQHFV